MDKGTLFTTPIAAPLAAFAGLLPATLLQQNQPEISYIRDRFAALNEPRTAQQELPNEETKNQEEVAKPRYRHPADPSLIRPIPSQPMPLPIPEQLPVLERQDGVVYDDLPIVAEQSDDDENDALLPRDGDAIDELAAPVTSYTDFVRDVLVEFVSNPNSSRLSLLLSSGSLMYEAYDAYRHVKNDDDIIMKNKAITLQHMDNNNATQPQEEWLQPAPANCKRHIYYDASGQFKSYITCEYDGSSTNHNEF